MADAPVPPQFNPGEDPKAAAKAAKAYGKAQRPWYKKKRFIIPLVFIALVVVVAALSDTEQNGAKKVSGGGQTTSGSDSGDGPLTVRIGETIELEGTQYTVKRVRTAARVGDEYVNEQADGKFVLITLTIENKKDSSKTFLDEAAKLIGGNGKEYSTDTDAQIHLEKPLMFEEMDPDVPKTGELVFDVPAAAVAGSKLRLSDLYGRGEAYVKLGLK